MTTLQPPALASDRRARPANRKGDRTPEADRVDIATATRTVPARKIRVLLLEDRAVDAELIVRELRRAGFDPDWQRVDTEDTFLAALDPEPDIILADYRLPEYNGLQALRRLQERKLDIPFIIISGVLGDELAVQCIKQGVSDYLLKDRLDRLGLAVSNAMDERRLRAERRLLDEHLRQAQKMEAVGLLAGGIAHDFNNLLTVINGHVFLLLEVIQGETFSPETRRALQQVYAAGERATSLTRQLLFFSRKRPIERAPLDLNVLIGEVAEMLRRLIGEHITLELELAPKLPPIEADSGMMEQIVVNLAVNARDAMPRGGRLVIGTEAVELADVDVQGKPQARAGQFVALWVKDSGCGIAPKVLARIFEPFFTTKDVGKGTGLGLATVAGIVQQHHGWLDVESQLEVGTTFRAFLPAAASGVQVPSKPADIEHTIGGGSETILVVEDEASVREFAVTVLQRYGYRVLQARSGVDALEVWQRHSARIDLLLTDMVMPDDMSGPELATRLRAAKPSLEVIFTSGYSEDMAGQVFGPPNVAHFIHKPYQPRELAKVVRETLDARLP